MAARTTLELRPLPYVVVAYILGALAAPAAAVVGPFGIDDLRELLRHEPQVAAEVIANLVKLAVNCLIAEVVLATPVLLAFARYRWRWLNGLTGVVLGLVVGVALAAARFALEAPTVSRLMHAVVGWDFASFLVSQSAAAGVAAALAIRLVAVRVAPSKAAATGGVFD